MGYSSNAISPWEVSSISHMLHKGVIDQKIYFSIACDRGGECVQVPRVCARLLDPQRRAVYLCSSRYGSRCVWEENFLSRKDTSVDVSRTDRREHAHPVRIRALQCVVRHVPGAQEAKPLCSCRGLVRLGPNSQRHCPRAISPDQFPPHPLEPCSYRTRYSIDTNTVPLGFSSLPATRRGCMDCYHALCFLVVCEEVRRAKKAPGVCPSAST